MSMATNSNIFIQSMYSLLQNRQYCNQGKARLSPLVVLTLTSYSVFGDTAALPYFSGN